MDVIHTQYQKDKNERTFITAYVSILFDILLYDNQIHT